MLGKRSIVTLGLLAFALLIFTSTFAANLTIYDEGIGPNWDNWSWGSTINFADNSQVKVGSNAISVRFDSAWVALYLQRNLPVDATDYRAVSFWAHGGSQGGQMVNVTLIDSAGTWHAAHTITLATNEWGYHELSLAELGNPATIAGIAWQDATGAAQPTFYLDEIVLYEKVDGGGGEVTHQLTVDPAAEIRPISPLIYGMSFADSDAVVELDLPVNRWGGNATTRYNFDADVSNRASDWYFENIANEVSGELPNDAAIQRFVADNQQYGAQTVVTLPMIGWTPKDRNVSCGFSVAKYGRQDSVDPWRNDCGNGLLNGQPIMGNDPADTSIPLTTADVQAWMNVLHTQHGEGATLFSYDNEPMLWHQTHRDVHPDPVGYDEIRDLTYLYGAAFKQQQPSAELIGPGVWGWTAYFYSAIDAASGQWNNPPDRNAHGGTPFVEWYLQEMQRYEQQNGVRLLDYLDLHYYPQQSGVTLQPAGGYATQQLRMNATRALWDVTYQDESWIGEPVRLIPRMQAWVDQQYPDTKLAITEYNFGGVEHINGAIAQAEVLGIFGREGVDLAVMWDPPTLDQPAMNAFRLYRNYDSAGGKFGEMSLHTTSSDRRELSVFAARRAGDQALTIVVINKTFDALSADLSVVGVGTGSAERFEYSNANLAAIQPLDGVTFQNGETQLTVPAQSMTLLVIHDDGTPEPTLSPTTPPTSEPTSSPEPTPSPTTEPTISPTTQPTATNTPEPTLSPTNEPTATPTSPPSNTLVADGESLVSGTITNGDFRTTWVDDGVAESLTERSSNGKPSNRTSLLEHIWTFAANGQPAELVVHAWAGANHEGETFTFSYSADGVNFTDAFSLMPGVDRVYQTTIPAGVRYVRVVDSNRTQGQSLLDTVHVDAISIISGDVVVTPTATTPPPSPTTTPPPSATPPATATPSPTPSATPPPTDADYATSEETIGGFLIAGDYQETFELDGVVEELRETETKGAASKRYSYLEHVWTIDVTDKTQLVVNGWAVDSDADSFVLAISADGGNTFQDAITLTEQPASHTFSLPSGTTGELLVRLMDSDRTAGERSFGNVYIDYLAVVDATRQTRQSNRAAPRLTMPNLLTVKGGSQLALPVWVRGSADQLSFTLNYDSLWFIADDTTPALVLHQPNVTFDYTLDAPTGELSVNLTGAMQDGLLLTFYLDVRAETPTQRIYDFTLSSSDADIQSGSLFVTETIEKSLVPTAIQVSQIDKQPYTISWQILGAFLLVLIGSFHLLCARSKNLTGLSSEINYHP